MSHDSAAQAIRGSSSFEKGRDLSRDFGPVRILSLWFVLGFHADMFFFFRSMITTSCWLIQRPVFPGFLANTRGDSVLLPVEVYALAVTSENAGSAIPFFFVFVFAPFFWFKHHRKKTWSMFTANFD